MAIVFELWVDTGDSKEDAINIRNYFNEISIIKTKFGEHPIWTSQCGLTGSMITVDGITRIGEYTEEEGLELSLIGHEYYRLLKNAPEFRFALVGFDVDGYYEFEDFVEDPTNLTIMSGIVIRKDLYEKVGSPGNFYEFRPNYVWTPYHGLS